MDRATTAITFTLDLEDHRPSPDARRALSRAHARRVLDFLDDRGVRGTFFVVGEIAEDAARPRRARSRRGPRDRPPRLAPRAAHRARRPVQLRADVEARQGPARGPRRHAGRRLPRADVLARPRVALGGRRARRASASPTRRACSRPAARCSATRRCPATPFRWPNGLVELPCPVVRVGGIGLPYLGGVYLRALPTPASAARPARASGGTSCCGSTATRTTSTPTSRSGSCPRPGGSAAGSSGTTAAARSPRSTRCSRGRRRPRRSRERLDRARHGRATRVESCMTEYSQLDMVHRLPPRTLVDRFEYLSRARRRTARRARRVRRRRLPDA